MSLRGIVLGACALAMPAACGDDATYRFASLTQVSGASPFAADCNGAIQTGTNYRGAEAEPQLAIDPTDTAHLVAAWQQDRWSSGGANGNLSGASFDGGKTWATGSAHFSRC